MPTPGHITHKCGHAYTWPIIGRSASTRLARAAALADQDCPECSRTTDYNVFGNCDPKLARLVGTDKQVAWALQIRRKRLREINWGIVQQALPANTSRTDAERILSHVARIPEATWWIQQRDVPFDVFVSEQAVALKRADTL